MSESGGGWNSRLEQYVFSSLWLWNILMVSRETGFWQQTDGSFMENLKQIMRAADHVPANHSPFEHVNAQADSRSRMNLSLHLFRYLIRIFVSIG